MSSSWRLGLIGLGAVLISSAVWANEAIDGSWYGDGGADSPYALKSRDTANDNSYAYTPSPDQWRDRNIYQLFTDRFATDGNNLVQSYKPAWDCEYSGDSLNRNYPFNRNYHHGGNWNGLKQQIPYLKGMGVTAVWISGVQQNDQANNEKRWTPYHQYHVDNFFRCDPAMGTFADLTSLIDTLHANNIAVILDVAPNHMCDKNGVSDPQTDKGYFGNRDSRFKWWNESNKHCAPFDSLDRFHGNGTINNWDTSPENLQGQFKGTDDLMQEDGTTSDYLYMAFKNLIDATDCDGFRVDAIKHIPYDWCRTWAQAIRDHAAWRGKRNFLMFGELFSYDHGALSGWCADGYGFNSALLFPLMQAMNNAFGSGYSGYQLGEEMSKISMYGAGKENAIAFLDNHDVNRFAQVFGGGDAATAKRIMAPAMTFLYMAPPVPLLYYGTEHMFNQGGHGNGTDRSWDDSNSDDGDWQRECMFDRGFQPGNASGDMFADWAKDRGLYYHIAWLNGLRNKCRALRRGGFEQRYYSGGQGIYAFTKWYDNEVALVVVNTADGQQSADIWTGKADTFRENGDGEVVSTDGNIHVTLDGKGSKIYICNFVDNSADVGGSGGGGGGSSLWANNTYSWPTEATTADTIYINTQAGPTNSIQSVKVIYGVNNPTGAWPFVEMAVNPDWEATTAGGAWYHYELPASAITSTGTLSFAICVSDGTNEFWDNNGGGNYLVSISAAPETDTIAFQSVSPYPTEPEAGGTLKITAAIASSTNLDVSALSCRVGYAINPEEGATWPTYPMIRGEAYTNEADVTNLWTYFEYTVSDLPVAESNSTLQFYLAASNGVSETIYANNNNNNYVVTIPAGSPVPSDIAITDPVNDALVVAPSMTNYALCGTAGANITGTLTWTNSQNGKTGTFDCSAVWSVNIPLSEGTNDITVSGSTQSTSTNILAEDAASNYSGAELNALNGGSGFSAWVATVTSAGLCSTWSDTNGFGVWSASSALSEAKRPFPRALQAGDTFSYFFKNGDVANGGGCGAGVCSSSDNDAGFRVWFNGGDSVYQTPAGATTIGWTTAGMNVVITMADATNYTAVITPKDGQAPCTVTGSFAATCDRFRFWSWSNNDQIEGNNYNVYADNLKRTATVMTPGTTVSDSVLLVAVARRIRVKSSPAASINANGMLRLTLNCEGGELLDNVPVYTATECISNAWNWNLLGRYTFTNEQTVISVDPTNAMMISVGTPPGE